LTTCAAAIKRIHFIVLFPSVNFEMSAKECLDTAPAKVFIDQAEFSITSRSYPVQQRRVSFEVAKGTR
jgi:hypothetical protein